MASQSASPSEISPRAGASLKLIVVDTSGGRRELKVTRSPFRIGRLPDCDLSLRDSRVSRNHAQILLEDGKYFIEDLESRHGLIVNGQKAARHQLRPADYIEFGSEDSYKVFVGAEPAFTAPLMEKVAAIPTAKGPGNLGQLSAVLDVALALQSSLAVDDVLDAAVDAALVVTQAERGFLMLRADDGELQTKVARDRGGKILAEADLRVPRGVIQKALDSRRDLLSMTASSSDFGTGPFNKSGTAEALALRSVICVPLVRIRVGQQHETSVLSARQDTLGVLYMDSREGELSSGNRELLQTLAIEISTVLENARLLEEERQKHDLEQELRIARDIQQSMLPPRMSAEGWLLAEGSSEACQQVGGDYFDVIQLSPDHWVSVLADVSGKGVSAALLTSLIQGAFFATATLDASLPQVVARINNYICERSRSAKFATVFYSAIERDGLLRWVNAGHCPTIVARASGEVECLEPTSFPIGLFPDFEFPQQECQLLPGDKLVIYSDGVSEAENFSAEQFGEERLKEVVARNALGTPRELLDTIQREINSFTAGAAQRDDLTLLVLGYQG
jgi:sigma-B regulation protein RsbU (phosphoserine phosphatase)